jgi:nitroimidazol reductase NimA-like FMN-containing flavoprotein (pyridoxamine 5'-phosphate oxidase superfamily)
MLMLGELKPEEIDQLLRTEQLGRIGCHAGGVTYVVPVSYVFNGTHIYALAVEGMKLRMMRENPRVCFEVEQVQRWYNWQTVIVWGTFEELHGYEAERAYRLLHSRLTPLIEFDSRTQAGDVSPPGAAAANQFVLYRIRVEERTGRFERL